MLLGPALDARPRVGDEQEPHIGIGGDHGRDVTPLGNDPRAGRLNDRLLSSDKVGPAGLVRGDDTDNRRHLRLANRLGYVATIDAYPLVARVRGDLQPRAAREVGDRLGVGAIETARQELRCHGPIHRARVEVRVTQCLGNPAGG